MQVYMSADNKTVTTGNEPVICDGVYAVVFVADVTARSEIHLHRFLWRRFSYFILASVLDVIADDNAERWRFVSVNAAVHVSLPSKHESFTHCWFNVGPASTSLAQH